MNIEDSKTAAAYAMGIIGLIVVGIIVFALDPEGFLFGLMIVLFISAAKGIWTMLD